MYLMELSKSAHLPPESVNFAVTVALNIRIVLNAALSALASGVESQPFNSNCHFTSTL